MRRYFVFDVQPSSKPLLEEHIYVIFAIVLELQYILFAVFVPMEIVS